MEVTDRSRGPSLASVEHFHLRQGRVQSGRHTRLVIANRTSQGRPARGPRPRTLEAHARSEGDARLIRRDTSYFCVAISIRRAGREDAIQGYVEGGVLRGEKPLVRKTTRRPRPRVHACRRQTGRRGTTLPRSLRPPRGPRVSWPGSTRWWLVPTPAPRSAEPWPEPALEDPAPRSSLCAGSAIDSRHEIAGKRDADLDPPCLHTPHTPIPPGCQGHRGDVSDPAAVHAVFDEAERATRSG